MRTAVILFVILVAQDSLAAPPTTCGFKDPYSRALCAYQHRNFGEAEAGFRIIVQEGAADPQTIRAVYFLARTDMKRGNFDEASKLLIRIYSLDRAIYDTWGCDFLLGECRRASGKE
jgi:TolA-binding protein